MSSRSQILVVAEAGEEGLRPITFELVTAARTLAESSGAAIVGLLMGSGIRQHAEQIAGLGVERVLVADDNVLEHLQPRVLTAVLASVIGSLQPTAVLAPTTTAGIEYAPRVAARLDLPMVSDAIDVSFDGGRIVAVRPILGGRVLTAVTIEGSGPAIITIRQGSFERAIPSGQKADVELLEVSVDEHDRSVQVTGLSPKMVAGVGLDTADVIVGGGRGLKEAKNFELVEQLAHALGGAVAATRAITDAGWRPHNEQIGQTGRIVSPRLYIAVGISGAVQHVAGLQGAEFIVAINRDPDAPIFKIASFGIVGDLFEVVPAVLAELQ